MCLSVKHTWKQLHFTRNNIYSSFWNVSETGFVITIYLADKIPFKRLFHGGGGLCVSFTLYNRLNPLPLGTFCIWSMSPHPLRCIQVHPIPHSNLVLSTFFRYKRKAKNRPWNTSNKWSKFAIRGNIFMNKLRNMQAAILKTSTGSQLCLVSKAKDKNKIKTYEQSADRDISLKCILYWQTRKGI